MKLFNRQEAGTASIRVTWRVVELWKLPAADLLDADDVGLLPLVPLADFDGPLEPILEECRDRIEREAPEDERENLRVVTHFLAGLKYNEPRLFEKLGGDRAMMQTGSPLLREMFAEERRDERRQAERDTTVNNIAAFLGARFGPEGEAIRAELDSLSLRQLKKSVLQAATCPDLASFREQMAGKKRRRKG